MLDNRAVPGTIKVLELAFGRVDAGVGGNRPAVKSQPIEEPDFCKTITLG
jgi:hypothetical protein